jgi:hypothetical protein
MEIEGDLDLHIPGSRTPLGYLNSTHYLHILWSVHLDEYYIEQTTKSKSTANQQHKLTHFSLQ